MPPFAPATFPGSGISGQQKNQLTWIAVVFGAALAILVPAVWNGFPFMFYDTGAFIDLAMGGGFRPERSVFYAAFLRAFGPSFSLWSAAVAQVVLTVLVMAEFARVVTPGLSAPRFFWMIIALCLCTALPWNAADILPDILAPLMVICLFLLGFHADRLTWPRKVALIAVAIFAATSHASHLGLAAGLAIAVGLTQIAARYGAPLSAPPRWQLPVLVFSLSLLALVTSNFALTGQVFVSRCGPSFVLARLVQDGIAKRVLDDTCPNSGYRLCAYKDNLPADSNDFLWRWDSPFWTLGGFTGAEQEAKSIVVESLKRYPLLNLKTAALNTAQQFGTFKTGDGIEELDGVPVPALRRHMPEQLDSYLAARQHDDGISFDWINTIQVPIGALSIAALATILIQAVRRRNWGDHVFLPAFVLLALLGNAFICGALSSPHDRYQSRLIWLACFAVLLLTAQPPKKSAHRID